jgi:hypothetical protein
LQVTRIHGETVSLFFTLLMNSQREVRSMAPANQFVRFITPDEYVPS